MCGFTCRIGEERSNEEIAANLTLEFFLEPRSHRLSTVAAPIECAPPLLPHYQNRHGNWLAWDGPDLHLVNRPTELESLDLDFDSLPQVGKRFDFPRRRNILWRGREKNGGLQPCSSCHPGPRGLCSNRQNKNSRVDSPRRVSDIFPDIPEFPTVGFVTLVLEFSRYLWTHV